MDEDEIEAFARRHLGPARLVNLKERMRGRTWLCSNCKLTITSADPIPVPAPCPKCHGVVFEPLDPPLQ